MTTPETAAALTAELVLDVPFCDVDAMQVVWHGHYLRYYEAVRGVLLRRWDYDYPQMLASGYLWPVIDCRMRYLQPLRYGMQMRLVATVLEWENRLLIGYLITDAATGRRLHRGHTVQVAVHAATGELCLESPPILWQKIGLTP